MPLLVRRGTSQFAAKVGMTLTLKASRRTGTLAASVAARTASHAGPSSAT